MNVVAEYCQAMAIMVLFVETVYFCMQKPSRMQLEILLMTTSIMIMFVGYTMELLSQSVEVAMFSVVINYIGKPFALLGALLFIADYCGKRIPQKWLLLLAIYHALFPLIIATNSLHMLYYSSVTFDRSRLFSPLILGHGPLYFLYMGTTVAHFVADLVLTIGEYKAAKTGAGKKQILAIFAMISCSILGYVVFLTGKTGGYDTTMIGTLLGVVILSILFIKYRMLDVLTLAKEHALDNASQGLLVINSRDNVMYTNLMTESLLKESFDLSELKALPEGIRRLQRRGKVYEFSKKFVYDKGVYFGQVLEIADISDQFNYSQKLEAGIRERTEEIRHMQRSVVVSFAGIIEERDNSTGIHVRRMSHIVEIVARELVSMGLHTDELTEEYITSLVDVAPLHDIGKLGIPDSILLKPGRLTDGEYAVMKTHTVRGLRVVDTCLKDVENSDYVKMAEQVVVSHHERWDGTGYPYGMSGEEIPLAARIAAVADVYDAIRSERCYKEAFSVEKSCDIIREGRGTQFDPDVVDAFLNSVNAIETALAAENAKQ